MMDKVNKALRFAVNAHEGQYRKDVELPFVVHPIAVMHTLASWGIRDEQVLIAALLHDTVEDTHIVDSDITIEFGSIVASIVEEVTRKDDTTQSDKDEYLRSFKDKSVEAIVLKIADRLNNVEDYWMAGKHRYAHKYFWRAASVFDLLDSRKQEIIDRFDEDGQGDEVYMSIVLDVRRLSNKLGNG